MYSIFWIIIESPMICLGWKPSCQTWKSESVWDGLFALLNFCKKFECPFCANCSTIDRAVYDLNALKCLPSFLDCTIRWIWFSIITYAYKIVFLWSCKNKRASRIISAANLFHRFCTGFWTLIGWFLLYAYLYEPCLKKFLQTLSTYSFQCSAPAGKRLWQQSSHSVRRGAERRDEVKLSALRTVW